MKLHHPVLTRRSFLQWSGMLAGAGLAAPFLPASAHPIAQEAARAQPARIGILTPDSSIEPALAEQFVSGYEAGWQQAASRRAVDLSVHAVGTTPGSAYEVARTLIASGVKLVHWLSDSPLSAPVRQLFEDHQALLLMSGAGANLPRDEDASPAVFHHTLGYWQAAWGLGHWAAGHVGKRARVFSSLYDSGYDLPYAFMLGFEAAGGQVLSSAVTHRQSGDLAGALDGLDAGAADFAAAFYCGAAGQQFLQAWAERAPGVPLVTGGGLHGQAAAGSAAWVSALPEKLAAPLPEEFALLGYEAACLIDAALSACDVDRAAGAPQALAAASVESPRGVVQMHAQSHLTGGPLFLHSASTGSAALAQPGLEDAKIKALRASTKTGWSHAYLFV